MNLADVGKASKAWPFVQARKLLERLSAADSEDGEVLFQTGYGPSGLPHIGTFAEVARTSMVRRAFEELSNRPTRLLCFSDDMDGMRKVPLNVPNRDELAQDLHLPLSKVRDPFGTHASFADHNNARLRSFLDEFGFDYEFASSTEYYASGRFDEMLLRMLERFDGIMEIMLPSLGKIDKSRRETYSPFLPVSPKSGKVLQVPTLERDVSEGMIVYREPDGEKMKVPVTGGHVKLQWKPDWAMRWAALDVQYEMYGKDLIPSAQLGTRICRALGKQAPVGFVYEMFLDEHGQKISKSTGTGFSMEEWLEYASPDSLSYFMYQKPQTAKRLYFDVIPKTVDDYHRDLNNYLNQDAAGRLNNPVWHIHGGNPPKSKMILTYSMLLNIASVASAPDTDVIWGYIRNYEPSASPESNPDLADAVACAARYFTKRVAPDREFRSADPKEAAALADLRSELLKLNDGTDAEELQKLVYSIGRKHAFEPMRNWFRAIYQVLLGSDQGPRFGSFVSLYGIKPTADLIEERLSVVSLTNKFHLYFDDTGNRDPDKQSYGERKDQMDCFGLGGIIVREEDIETILAKYNEFCTKWNIDYPLHSSRIRGGQGKFAWLKKSENSESFLPDLEEWLMSLPIIGIACVIHRPGYVERYNDCYREHLWLMCKTAFSILIERSAKFAEQENCKLEVFFEQTGKKEDGNIAQYAKELKECGSPFSAGTSGAYEPLGAEDFKRVVLGEPRRRTKMDPMCQIADLVLYPIAKGGYDPEYPLYVKFRKGGKLIDSHLDEEVLHQIGIKYSCFDFLKK